MRSAGSATQNHQPDQKMKYRTLLLLFGVIALGGLQAQVPPLVNYQGRVAVNAINFQGSGQFKFALVNTDGTVTFWSNDGTSNAGSEPASAITLSVEKGLYSVLLGDPNLPNMTAIPATIFANPDVRLRVWFNDGTNGSQLLTPDQRLAPSAYLSDAAVTTAAIADSAVTSEKIAAGAVTGANIATASISGTNIAAGSLDFSHLTVPAAPAAGQVLSFDGTSLNWTAPGAGDGIWSLNGTDAFRTSGNVGIGTNVPLVRLEVRSVPGDYGIVHSDGTIRVGTYVGNSSSGANGGWLGTLSNHPLHLFTNNGQPSATLSTGGNFGLGTSTPGARLHIFNPTTTVGEVIETNGPVNSQSVLGFKNLNGQWNVGISRGFNNDIFFMDRLGTAPLEFQLSTSGALGLGIEPQAKLHLYEPATSVSHRIQTGAGTNSWARVEFVNGNGQWNIGTSRGFDSDELYFFRQGATTNAFALQTNGDATLQGTMSVKVLTIRGGADLAEPFAMSHRGIPPGAVVSIDPQHPGKLKMSANAYDRKVAGIVSGANGIQPGISMIQEGALEAGENVALSGRVYVKANVSGGPIQPGDLLTTSDVPGEAMRAADYDRAPGSILGKAMTALEKDAGEVLVLVTLQ